MPAMHSVMLAVPDRPEEALNWCGPATGQMTMEGYPSGSCSHLQEDVWMSIQSYKTEIMWDTDPVGLKDAMNSLCTPATGRWHVYQENIPQQLMFRVAYWMTRNNYPVAALLNTVSHNSFTAHAEHWVTVRGIITDVDPTTNPSVNLLFIWFNDPAVPLGDSSIERFVSGGTWYSEFKPVTKAGSSYLGKYVAIIEPPRIRGMAKAPVEVLVGKVIASREALRYAAKWIEEYKLYEIKPYSILKRAKPLTPLLVNKSYGGYYIIPYAVEEESRLADAALIVNAYTGNFQEVGAFKPVAYMPKEDAIGIALKHLMVRKPARIDAKLIFPIDEQTVSRYFPIWKVTVDKKTLGIDRQGKIQIRIPHEKLPS